MDLSRIINNPYMREAGKICYSKKNVYDFELEKRIDEKTLLKKFATAL